ncbi:ABC transporter substrate-binding protein [Actinomadura sp. WMMB 499]|uniref:ABC transporter substrate-binding protein n=1 Tax=Actinomadura sp. WMMB 499 TaxID=1219491 RepID=UPI001247259D|nr:ABC transporter substrate-binding protein [Actinomadura sp. WMMB 499]QFG26536.1 ABC transporter substrate-binding protein [Actinomadura sp. WMMB 499]
MRKIVPLLAAAVLAAATACGGAGGADGSLKIGFIESLTGNYASLGGEAKKTVELAVEQINDAGGIGGETIELITLDDRTSPDQGVLHFNRLRSQDVTAIIGSTYANVALAVQPLAEREKIPYISLAPADEQVDPIREYTFVIPALSSTYARAMLGYFGENGITDVAVAYDTKSAYAMAGFEGMKAHAAEHGVRIVKEEPFEANAGSFSPLFTHVRDSGARALVVWASGPPGVTLAKQFPSSGLDMPLFMTGSQASRLWLDPVGEAAEGVHVQSAIGVVGEHLPDGTLKRSIQEMSGPFQQKHGYAPPQFAMDGYAAVKLLAAAIEKAGADREKIRDALEGLSLVTPNGQYNYSPTDHSGLKPSDISMNRVRDGELVPTEWSRTRLARTARALG